MARPGVEGGGAGVLIGSEEEVEGVYSEKSATLSEREGGGDSIADSSRRRRRGQHFLPMLLLALDLLSLSWLLSPSVSLPLVERCFLKRYLCMVGYEVVDGIYGFTVNRGPSSPHRGPSWPHCFRGASGFRPFQ